MSLVTIHGLHTSPGHNYFGRHGQAAGDHPAISHKSVELIAGRGIPGDRFFDWKDDYKGQLTLIDRRVIDDVRAHAANSRLPDSAFRRNIVISGFDLNSLVGKKFRLAGVLLEGTAECSPCYWMDRASGKPGTEALMKGRGGLRCRILESGTLALGETRLSLADPRESRTTRVPS